MADEFFAKLKLMVTRQGDVIGNDLYQRPVDPDAENIANLDARVKMYRTDIEQKGTRVDALSSEIAQLRAQCNGLAKESPQYKSLVQRATLKMQEKKRLEEAMVQDAARLGNFEVNLNNRKKQKRDEDDARLLRETNVRLAIAQETLDLDAIRDTVRESRTANRDVNRASSALDAPLTTDAYTATDDLMAEFEAMELGAITAVEDVSNTGTTTFNTNTASATTGARRNNTNSVLDNY